MNEIYTLIESTEQLYKDIDECIDKLVQSRINRNVIQSSKALTEMESLMVATLQQLRCILDYLNESNLNVT